MAALAGVGAGAAAGGLIGALVGMGIPEYEAKRYEGRVKDGGVLLSVHCDDSDWVSKAKDILKRTGADDIASAGEKAVSTHTVDATRAPELRGTRTSSAAAHGELSDLEDRDTADLTRRNR
jgi:hypothetical protein